METKAVDPKLNAETRMAYRAEQDRIKNGGTEDATGQIMHPSEKPKKEQKVSYSYALKAMSDHAKKLVEGGFWTEEEYNQYKELHQIAVRKYMEKELGM